MNETDTPILITGVERSGSSIIARIISMCRVHAGEVSGMYENERIKVMMNNFLYGMGVDTHCQYPLLQHPMDFFPKDFAEKITDILELEKYDSQYPWMYKSFRILNTWEIWNHFYPNAKWVIVLRRYPDVLDSCIKTSHMGAFQTLQNRKDVGAINEKAGWRWWYHEQQKQINKIKFRADVNTFEIYPEKMAYNNFSEVYNLLDWLGLTPPENLEETIKPLFNNSKQKQHGK